MMRYEKTLGKNRIRPHHGKGPAHAGHDMTGENLDIWSAAKAGELARVSELCAEDSALIDARDGNGCTPIISAAESGELRVIDWLITQGADVNAQNAQRATALLQALWFHRIDCAKRLLRAGADPNLADDELRTPLLSAATMGYRSVAVDLFTPRARVATEEPKSTDGYIEIATLLIEHGADVNARNEDGVTPLHQAARWGTEAHQEMCELLLSRGADINCIDRDGSSGVTPLQAVRQTGNQKMAEFLLARGARDEPRSSD
jgi:ankyrin repeat protein